MASIKILFLMSMFACLGFVNAGYADLTIRRSKNLSSTQQQLIKFISEQTIAEMATGIDTDESQYWWMVFTITNRLNAENSLMSENGCYKKKWACIVYNLNGYIAWSITNSAMIFMENHPDGSGNIVIYCYQQF